MNYLTAEEVLSLHYMVMEKYGEGEQAGILLEDRFYAAIERPQMILFGQEVHPTLWRKAGALTQSIIQGHPFHNGNKRTAFICLIAFLELNGYTLNMSPEIAEELMVTIATDERFKGDDGPEEIGGIVKEYIDSGR